MTTIKIQGDEPKNFKQVEESWLSSYLPAISGAVLMITIVLLAIACSKKSNNVANISAPTQPAVTSPATNAPLASVPEVAKKKVAKKHRPVNATYVNSIYGVSFSYPRKYSLQSGDKLGSSTLPSFLKPGATQVAMVDMPDDSYPETDFSSALLNVSVSRDMTADECAHFVPPLKDAGEVKPTTVKIGVNEYSVFEQISGVADRKSDLKYFHLFKNNACYEFALDVDTVEKLDTDLAQVDRGKVLKQLEKIVSTARIKDLQAPEVETAKAAAGDLKTGEVKTTETKSVETTEKAQVVTPEQK